MSLYFLRDGQFHCAGLKSDGTLDTTKNIYASDTVGKGFAPLAPDWIFFLDASNKVIEFRQGTISVATELQDAIGMFSFRHRVYVFNSSGLTIIDPASKTIERVRLPFTVTDIQYADTGFITLSEAGDAHFFFLDGRSGSLLLEHKAVALLGRYRRRIHVLQENGQVVSVGEDGTIATVTTPSCDKKFVSLEDHVIILENTTLQSVDGTVLVSGHVSFPQFVTSKPDDSCIICYCEYEEDDAGVILDCGHQFHAGCLEECTKRSEGYLQTGEHISFSMAKCPAGCGMLVRHSSAPRSGVIAQRFAAIQRDSAKELHFLPPNKTADDLLFYSCASCVTPFFGGLKVCPRMAPEPKKDPSDLLCDNCQPYQCETHGKSFVIFQCRYCCNVATHRCFGNRFACDRCEARWEKGEPDHLACQPDTCPYKGVHQTVGCLLCFIESGHLDVSKIQS